MSGELLFDTLNYAKMLERGGISHSDVHAVALADALTQNLYSKNEIEEMIENVMRQFKEEMHSFRIEVKSEINDLRLEMKELESSLEKKISLKLGVMTGFITLVIALSHFLQ